MITIRKISVQTILLAFLTIPAFSQGNENKSGESSAGERNFSRMANSQGKTCADCHYSLEPDTINWNPSTLDLAKRSGLYSVEGIGKYFTSPEGKLMKVVHDGIRMSPDEETQFIAYLGKINASAIPTEKHIRWRLIMFIGLFVLLILLRIERRRIRKLPKTLRLIIVPAAWAVILIIIYQDAAGFNLSRNYAPVQPVKFSHSIHSTGNKIDCKYCHSGVLKGKNAGIPPVSLCMNCHKHQKEGTLTGFFEIRKVNQAAEDSVPIHWIRVHNLPDFTYFNHMQHVTVGGVDCITCHGDVGNMHIITQTEDLSMGWCITCHDKTAVDFSNEYYKLYYPALVDSLLTGKIDSVMVSDIGGRECGRCHY